MEKVLLTLYLNGKKETIIDVTDMTESEIDAVKKWQKEAYGRTDYRFKRHMFEGV